MVTAIVDKRFKINKEEIIKEMIGRGIDCRPFFYPLSSLPAYSDHTKAVYAKSKNTNAYSVSPYGINLPSGYNMDSNKVAYVCEQLKEILSMRLD